MHGGIIYIRGKALHMGKEVEVKPLDERDNERLRSAVEGFCKQFRIPSEPILSCGTTKLAPTSKRPYGNLYAY